MAVYTGKINLINMSDITATVGNGIQSTLVLYAISDSGVEPPDLANVPLQTIEGDLLAFWEIGATFHLVEDVLWARKDGKNIQLSISDNHITGIIGKEKWTESIPEVPDGWYLWSKTIFYYTNGEQTVVYGVTKYGENGKEGPPGPQGEDVPTYKLEFNQTEILKFVNKEQNISISPEELTIRVLKQNVFSSDGYEQIENPSIENLIVQLYNLSTGEIFDIPTNFIKTDELIGNTFIVSLGEIAKIAPSEEYYSITRTLLNDESIFKITYTYNELISESENKTYFLVDFVDVRFAMGKDIASLDIYANGIFSSIQNAGLSFTAEGLTIKNGAFKIVKELDGGTTEDLLYSDNGNLAIKGNIYADQGYFSGELRAATGTFAGDISAATGTFSGELKAATGTFAGDISAARGTIGGFQIEGDKLISLKTDENGIPNITLNGSEGKIEAENIVLGTGAQIKEYIKLGDQVVIKNPTFSRDSFIEVKDENNELLSLKADGTFSVGYGDNSIILSGADGSITSQNFKDGLGWKISNKNSIFNDVTVRGSIRASVLEYGETQAIGGTLLVRPSSRILSAVLSGENTVLTLEEVKGFNSGDFCRIDIQTENSIGHEFYKIVAVNEVEKKIEVIGNAIDSQGKPIVNFGQEGDNVGISINGSVDDSFSTPQSISVFDFNETNKIITPRIVLGKLPNEKTIYGYAAGTYGLYAENVLLKGALVTQVRSGGETVYSGINTIYSNDISSQPVSDRYANNFQTKTGAPILLWAGARGDDKESIETSNFFVDRNGNMYANSGYFKGTIITDATITASEINTAVLRGNGNSPALTIEDATKGIVFTANDDQNGSKVVFEVTKNSITANVPNFNFNNNFTIGENGSLVVPNLYVIGRDGGTTVADEPITEAIILDRNKIFYTEAFKKNELDGDPKSYIDFSNGLIFSFANDEILKLSTAEARFKKNLYLEGSIQYNELMEYRPVYSGNTLIGYDLYVD